ncbi:tetratricopeptide repeat protein [Marinimicrococcus flavescens]|uniref:Tetratricopeptide repeat protein n=1 Tax=Marinimicrococcus flavescens TaxID=3031815 RepID=A0AAP3XQ92_9PROT|nr:tetratricopeptide repeat protein [Marinimicrococcus flavescens]
MLLGLLAWLAAPAAADQNDPRLDPLFARLKQVDAVEARGVEARIWILWGQSGDPHSQELLEAGSVAMANRDYGAARSSLDALVERAPGFAEGWNRRATLFWVQGEYAASVRDIRRTLALEPRHFGALSGLGLIYMTIGESEAALRSFEAALEIHPNLPGARHHADLLRRGLDGAPL